MARGAPDDWTPSVAPTYPYQVTIDTPKNTPSTAKQDTTVTLEKGLVAEAMIVLPWGSVGLLYVQVFNGTTQILPKGSGYFHGEGVTFLLERLNYPLMSSPYQLIIKTWNDDDTFAHQVDVYLDVSVFD